MTIEEINDNWQEVSKATVKEISGLYDLGCFKRYPRHKSHNIIDDRWVITWNMTDGSVGIKCRSAVQGFKGKFQDLDIYAGATSTSGLVIAVAAENPDFVI